MKGGKRKGAGRPKEEPTRPIFMRVPEKYYDAILLRLKEIVKEYCA